VPAGYYPLARQHRLFRAKVFAVTPGLHRMAGATIPVAAQSALAAEASQAPPRMPAAVQAATAVVVRIVVMPALAAQAVVRARPLSWRQIAVGTCSSPARSDWLSEPIWAMRSVLANCSPPAAAHQASSDRLG
jgi:hypothetical protein